MEYIWLQSDESSIFLVDRRNEKSLETHIHKVEGLESRHGVLPYNALKNERVTYFGTILLQIGHLLCDRGSMTHGNILIFTHELKFIFSNVMLTSVSRPHIN
jgi:hypothetical protein